MREIIKDFPNCNLHTAPLKRSNVSPLVILPPLEADVRRCLSGDTLVVAGEHGVRLYKWKSEDETMAWECHETREENCFQHSYLCASMDPYFISRGNAEHSRYFRYFCVAAGSASDGGHSICVASSNAASTFVHHHELHGLHRICCVSLSPVTSAGPTNTHQCPLVVSVDESGSVCVFDVDRSGAQRLLMEEVHEVPKDNTPFQIPHGYRAQEVLLHGPCEDPLCGWCHEKNCQRQRRGTPLTLHLVLMPRRETECRESTSSLVLQLHVLWTTKTAVLVEQRVLWPRSQIPALSFREKRENKEYESKLMEDHHYKRGKIGEAREVCPVRLSFASSTSGALLLQLIGSPSDSLIYFHACTGEFLDVCSIFSSPSSPFTKSPKVPLILARWLPLGRRFLSSTAASTSGPYECAVVLTAVHGSILLVGRPCEKVADHHWKSKTQQEIDRWLEEDVEEDGNGGVATTAEKEMKVRDAVLLPRYVILRELFSSQDFNHSYSGMFLSGTDFQRDDVIQTAKPCGSLYFDTVRQLLHWETHAGDLYSLSLPFQSELSDNKSSLFPVSSSASAPVGEDYSLHTAPHSTSSSAVLKPSPFSSGWGFARTMASTLFSAATATTNRNYRKLQVGASNHTSSTLLASPSISLSRNSASSSPRAIGSPVVEPHEVVEDCVESLYSPCAGGTGLKPRCHMEDVTLSVRQNCAKPPSPASARDHERAQEIAYTSNLIRGLTAETVRSNAHIPSEPGLAVHHLLSVWEMEAVEEPRAREGLEWQCAEDRVCVCAHQASRCDAPSLLEFFDATTSSNVEEEKGYAWGPAAESIEQEGFFSPSFFEEYYSLESGGTGPSNQLRQWTTYLASYRSEVEQAEVPPQICDLQDKDRLTYEIQDLLLRHEVERQDLTPFEDVTLYEIQERVRDPPYRQENDIVPVVIPATVTLGMWRRYATLEFCDQFGKKADMGKWNDAADSTKKGLWRWMTAKDEETVKAQEGELKSSAFHKKDTSPQRQVVCALLQGWTLGRWEYTTQWPNDWGTATNEEEAAWDYIGVDTEISETYVFRRRRLTRRRAHLQKLVKWERRNEEMKAEVRRIREGLLGS